MADTTISEEWRPIEGWPDYEVSNLGRIRRATDARAGTGTKYIKFPRGHLMSPHTMPNGYLRLGLRRCPEGKRENVSVHRLVCEAFHGPAPSAEHHAAHWDGNRQNNTPENLRWATCTENHADKIRHGTNKGWKINKSP